MNYCWIRLSVIVFCLRWLECPKFVRLSRCVSWLIWLCDQIENTISLGLYLPWMFLFRIWNERIYGPLHWTDLRKAGFLKLLVFLLYLVWKIFFYHGLIWFCRDSNIWSLARASQLWQLIIRGHNYWVISLSDESSWGFLSDESSWGSLSDESSWGLSLTFLVFGRSHWLCKQIPHCFVVSCELPGM